MNQILYFRLSIELSTSFKVKIISILITHESELGCVAR